MRYVSEVDNLKLMMVLLKDQSRSIQFEAFHVFKARPCCTPACLSLQCKPVNVVNPAIRHRPDNHAGCDVRGSG